jgi:signal transduction histidine kinase/CheY-like chemotaxis protein
MTVRRRRLSIRAQVLGAVLVAVAVVASALLIFFAQRQRTQATKALEARVAGTADMLAVGVALGLRSTDFSGISRAMSWARRDPAILWAVVVDAKDQPLAQYTPTGDTVPTPDKRAPLGRVIRKADVLTITVPVLDGEERLGQLHLGVSMAAAESEIRQDQRTGLAVALGISLFATLFGIVVSRRISSPIEALRDAAVNVAGGQAVNFPVRGSNETAELGRAFRAMAAQIQETLGALKAQATELAESRDTALGATQAKSLFLATMSHELRTPMTGVLGMLDLLMGSTLSGKQLTFARTARDSADSLLVLIDDILDFSKIEAGKLSLEQVPFDPRAVAEDVAALLAERAHRKQLSLVCDVATDVPASVVGDSTRIRQVLLNLGGNAIKFTSAGEVRIEVRVESASPAGTTIRFVVCDSGIGMASDVRAHLFSPFTQAEASTTRRFGGTGLGLSICRGLVQLMGGSIDVESAAGQGSTFTVRIPFEVAAGATPPVKPLAGRRALLIHRPGMQRAVTSAYLREGGADVTECASVDAIAGNSVATTPDVVLIEGAGVATSAHESVVKLRQLCDLSSARVIILVTLDSPVLLDEEHSVSVLSLPVRRHALLAAATAPVEARATPKVMPNDTVRPTSGHVVLVVEDNPVNRIIAEYMLRDMGHDVLLAENGQEALETVARTRVDLVFMDCQMPVLDGFEAARALRAREDDTVRLPIVALTANAVKGDREKCLAAGMDDYLSKPYTRVQLAAACARWLATPEPSEWAAPGAGLSDAKPLDLLVARLREVLGESEDEFILDLLARYLRASDEILVALRAAHDANDRPAIHRLAHRLRGSSATICADDVAALAGELEALHVAAESHIARELIVRISRAVDALRQVVHAE